MRDLLQERVLARALPWALVGTALSVPRMAQGPYTDPLWPLIAFAFFVLMLAMGTIFAWGRQGGLAGFMPRPFWETRKIALICVWGVLVALLLAMADIPLRNVLQNHEKPFLEKLAYPRQFGDWLILCSWNIGFMALFFTCAAMAVFTRVTRHWIAALIIVAGLRWVSAMYRLSTYDLLAIWPIATITTLAFAIPGCWLYARHGYPAVILFTFLTDTRHLIRDDFEW